MTAPFSFRAPVAIAFGPGRLAGLGRDAARLAGGATRVLLVADPFLVENGLASRAAQALAGAGHAVSLCGEMRGEAPAGAIDALAARARQEGAGCLVALGGGSTMDAAKLAAAIAVEGEGAETYALGAARLPGRGLPKIAVPTTAGTGSEVTRTAVFEAGGRKLWAWGEALRFDLALLDPAATIAMGPALTAATGIDAAVHAIESATCKRRNPISSALALGALADLRRWLKTAVEQADHLEARGRVQIAACAAGLAFDATGVAAAHAIGHALGALAGVHHGRAVGLALTATMADGAAAAPEAYGAVASALGAAAGGEAAAFARWLDEVGLDRSLAGDGLGPADAGRIAALALAPENRPMLEGDGFGYDSASLEAAAARMFAAA